MEFRLYGISESRSAGIPFPLRLSHYFFVKVNEKIQTVWKMSVNPLTNNEKCVKLKVSQK